MRPRKPNKKVAWTWFSLTLLIILGSGLVFIWSLDRFELAKAERVQVRAPKRVLLSAVGDLLVDFGWMTSILDGIEKEQGREKALEYPFEGVRQHLKGIVVGNLEGPVSRRAKVPFKDKNEPFYFNAGKRGLEILSRAGFQALSLANNHIKDCGDEGLLETLRNCEAQGLRGLGAGADRGAAFRPVLLEQGGMKVALLAFDQIRPVSVWATADCPGAAHGDAGELYEAVCGAKAQADAVVVLIHWGIEVRFDDPAAEPLPEQRALARALVEAGATAILGCHSHALGKVEEIGRSVVFYSLGNFVFAGTTKPKHKTSAIAQLSLRPGRVESYTLVPVRIDPPTVRYRPRVLEGEEGKAVVARVLPEAARLHRPF